MLVRFFFALCLVCFLSASAMAAQAPSILGEWCREDGHCVTFRHDGEVIKGEVVTLGPLASHGYSVGEAIFLLTPGEDPAAVAGRVKLRRKDGTSKLGDVTFIIKSDRMEGMGKWRRLAVAPSYQRGRDPEPLKPEVTYDEGWTVNTNWSVDVDKTLLAPGETLKITYTSDPAWKRAWLGLIPAEVRHGSNGHNDNYDRWYTYIPKDAPSGEVEITAPREPGWYEIRMFTPKEIGKEVTFASFVVMLPENYEPKAFILESEKDTVTPAESFKVTYSGHALWPNNAWIGLVKADALHTFKDSWDNRVSSQELGGKKEGEKSFGGPNEPGDYELRMFTGHGAYAREVAAIPIKALPEPDWVKYLEDEKARGLKEAEAMEFHDEAITQDDLARMLGEPELTVPEPPAVRPPETLTDLELRRLAVAWADYRGYEVPLSMRLEPAAWSGPMPPTVLAAVDPASCSDKIDKEVEIMRKLDITLGRDNKLSGAMKDMVKSLATKWAMPPGSTAAALQKAGNMGLDVYTHGSAAWADIGEGRYGEASVEMVTGVLKTLLAACNSPECLAKISKTADAALFKYAKKLPFNDRRKVAEELYLIMGKTENVESIHKALDKGAGTDFGKTGAQLQSGDYKRAFWTLTSTAASAFFPEVDIALKGANLTFEAMRYAKDMITDQNTQHLYEMYKKWYDEGAGGQDFFNAFAMKDGLSLRKAKEKMRDHPSMPLIKKALAARKTGELDKDGKPKRVTDEQAWDYLMAQFKSWKEAEDKAGKKADYHAGLKDDFLNLECRSSLNLKVQPWKSAGLWDRGKNWWYDGCPSEVEAFKQYVSLRKQIEADFLRWEEPGGKCSKENVQAFTKSLACTYLQLGVDSYRHSKAAFVDGCGWLPDPDKLTEDLNGASIEARLAGNRADTHAILAGTNNAGTLNCLCRYEAPMVSAHYNPKASDASPACKTLANGVCMGGNWGCGRWHMRTDAKALKACGAGKAITKWQRERRERYKKR